MLSIKVQDLLIGKNIYLYHYTCSSFKTCLKRYFNCIITQEVRFLLMFEEKYLSVSLHNAFNFSTCLRRMFED